MTEEVMNTPTPIKPSNFESVVFSLEVVRLKTASVAGANKVVVQVNYCLNAEYAGLHHRHEGEIWFDPTTVVIDGNFIPFESLTKEVVKQWITAKYPELHIKYSLASILAQKKQEQDEATNNNLPWSN